MYAYDDEWIANNYKNYSSWREVHLAHEEKVASGSSFDAFKDHCTKRMKLSRSKRYTEKQIQFLRENYPSKGVKALIEFMEIFNKGSIHSLQETCRTNGITINEDRKKEIIGIATRNCLKKCASRELPIGTYSTGWGGRGKGKVWWVKTQNGWERVARIKMLEKSGLKEFPDGYCIIHLDGNTLNDDLDNLALVALRHMPELNYSCKSNNKAIKKGLITLFELQDKVEKQKGVQTNEKNVDYCDRYDG